MRAFELDLANGASLAVAPDPAGDWTALFTDSTGTFCNVDCQLSQLTIMLRNLASDPRGQNNIAHPGGLLIVSWITLKDGGITVNVSADSGDSLRPIRFSPASRAELRSAVA